MSCLYRSCRTPSTPFPWTQIHQKMNIEIGSDVDYSSAESQSQISSICERSSNGSYSSSVSDECLPNALGVQYQEMHTPSVELRSHVVRGKLQVHHTMNVQNCSDGDSSSAGSRFQVDNISGSSSDGSCMTGVSDGSQSNVNNKQLHVGVLERSMPSCCKEYVDITTMKMPNRCSVDGARVLSKLLLSDGEAGMFCFLLCPGFVCCPVSKPFCLFLSLPGEALYLYQNSNIWPQDI